jgi:hypothetical protein
MTTPRSLFAIAALVASCAALAAFQTAFLVDEGVGRDRSMTRCTYETASGARITFEIRRISCPNTVQYDPDTGMVRGL